jgi:hypothetical protein
MVVRLKPCLWCGQPIRDHEEGNYQLCNPCLSNVERFGLDPKTVEAVLHARRRVRKSQLQVVGGVAKSAGGLMVRILKGADKAMDKFYEGGKQR